MCKKSKICIFGIFVFVLNAISVNAIDFGGNNKMDENYGPYTIKLLDHKPCKGPKSRDLTKFQYSIRFVGESIIGIHNVTFPEQGKLEEIKMSLFSVKENIRKLLYNYRIKEPCKHFMLAEFVLMRLNGTDCVIKKGTYRAEVNYLDFSRGFFGNSFFYGEYVIKSVAFSSKGNIMCMMLNFEFVKA